MTVIYSRVDTAEAQIHHLQGCPLTQFLLRLKPLLLRKKEASSCMHVQVCHVTKEAMWHVRLHPCLRRCTCHFEFVHQRFTPVLIFWEIWHLFVFVLVIHVKLCAMPPAGSGNGSAGGAAAGLGRGDSGWRPSPALGETLVSRRPGRRLHRGLPVSPLHNKRTPGWGHNSAWHIFPFHSRHRWISTLVHGLHSIDNRFQVRWIEMS